jgi:hypothetical protein
MTFELSKSPAPEDEPSAAADPGDPPHDSAPGGPGKKKRTRSRRIHTVTEIQEQLSALPSLIAMGLLSAGRANAIRSCLEASLRAHLGTAGGQRSQIRDDDVLRVYRENPQYMEFLEPLLDDRQIELLFGQGEQR